MQAHAHSLRELVWMAEGRRDHDGRLIAWELGHVIGCVTGEWFDLAGLNPFARREAEPEKTPERRDRESRAGWALLDRCWGGATVARIQANEREATLYGG